ncbi:hypothetical protein VM1G_06490 [Cytospora mali]|uniref:Yeast cell wall synthesis Kre9/Knh1-like N-terminal domain-containing protein n=1 Tax=Cytospora mali TaxID=578113 RepID=A0A194W3E1_CYTMA|nr:hypothetical protein VM1G_06490 [Valsa mali]
MVSTLTLLALASGVIALQVTSPTSSDVWTVGDSETITWNTVSSDQDSFNIYLSNMASYPSQTILLASDVSSSAGSAKVDGSKLVAGNSFTINFTNGTETEQIYAQSNQFNITASTSTSSSSSQGSSSTTSSSSSSSSAAASSSASTAAATSSSSSASSTESAASTASSTGKSSSTTATGTASESSTAKSTGTATGTAASKSSTAAATSGAGKIVAGWMGLAAVAALAL